MREPVDISVQDGTSQLTIRVTPMSGYKAALFEARVALLLGIPSLTAMFGKTADEIVGRLVQASVKYEDVKPLLDELLTCCARVTDMGTVVQITPGTVDGQISQPGTIWILWAAALKASCGFFTDGGLNAFQDRLRLSLKQIA